MKSVAIKLTSPEAIRAACELSIARGERHVQVMYKSDDFDDDDYVGADLEEFASVKDDPEELAEFCGGRRHSWELWTYERPESECGSLDAAIAGATKVESGLQNKWSEQDDDAAEKEGWRVSYCLGLANGEEYRLERVDEMGLFAGDKEAWAYVVERAKGGSDLHARALAFIKVRNPKEHAAITEVTDGEPAPDILNSPLLASLRAILPYAQAELASLQEAQKRDGDMEAEVAACDTAIEEANRLVSQVGVEAA